MKLTVAQGYGTIKSLIDPTEMKRDTLWRLAGTRLVVAVRRDAKPGRPVKVAWTDHQGRRMEAYDASALLRFEPTTETKEACERLRLERDVSTEMKLDELMAFAALMGSGSSSDMALTTARAVLADGVEHRIWQVGNAVIVVAKPPGALEWAPVVSTGPGRSRLH